MKYLNNLTEFKDRKFDIIVVAGQSNAEGYGKGAVQNEYVPDDRILLLTDDSAPHYEKNDKGVDVLKVREQALLTVSIAEEPVGADGKTGRLGYIFARRYMERAAADRQVLLIQAAVGGTGFRARHWGLGNVLYDRMTSMTESVMRLNGENRIVAVIWHQGENDSLWDGELPAEVRQSAYLKSLSEMMADFTATFGCRNVPFLTGGFCGEWYRKNKLMCDPVLAALRQYAEEAGGRFVETDDLPSNNQALGNGDDIHFCRQSLYILGDRFYDAYCEIINSRASGGASVR